MSQAGVGYESAISVFLITFDSACLISIQNGCCNVSYIQHGRRLALCVAGVQACSVMLFNEALQAHYMCHAAYNFFPEGHIFTIVFIFTLSYTVYQDAGSSFSAITAVSPRRGGAWLMTMIHELNRP